MKTQHLDFRKFGFEPEAFEQGFYPEYLSTQDKRWLLIRHDEHSREYELIDRVTKGRVFWGTLSSKAFVKQLFKQFGIAEQLNHAEVTA